VVEKLPEHELTCVSEPAWEHKKVKLLLNGNHLELQAVRPQYPRGDEASLPEKHQAPLPNSPNVEVVL
jgi:hypothetical protein